MYYVTHYSDSDIPHSLYYAIYTMFCADLDGVWIGWFEAKSSI